MDDDAPPPPTGDAPAGSGGFGIEPMAATEPDVGFSAPVDSTVSVTSFSFSWWFRNVSSIIVAIFSRSIYLVKGREENKQMEQKRKRETEMEREKEIKRTLV